MVVSNGNGPNWQRVQPTGHGHDQVMGHPKIVAGNPLDDLHQF